MAKIVDESRRKAKIFGTIALLIGLICFCIILTPELK